jgi:hypothetical protein
MAKEKESVAQVIVPKKGVVINRMNHPITVTVGNEQMQVPPRGRRAVEDISVVSGVPSVGVKILETINE